MPLLVKAQYGKPSGVSLFSNMLIALDVLTETMHQHNHRAGFFFRLPDLPPKRFTIEDLSVNS